MTKSHKKITSFFISFFWVSLVWKHILNTFFFLQFFYRSKFVCGVMLDTLSKFAPLSSTSRKCFINIFKTKILHKVIFKSKLFSWLGLKNIKLDRMFFFCDIYIKFPTPTQSGARMTTLIIESMFPVQLYNMWIYIDNLIIYCTFIY